MTTRGIRAVLFDLDGTLADTLTTIAYFANAALVQYGYPPIEISAYRYLVGNGADNLVRGMLHKVGAENEQVFTQVRAFYNQSYDDNFLYLTDAYEGIRAMLAGLRDSGIKLGVLSNKPHATTVKIVEALFGDCFSLCYGKREGIPRKPDPIAALSMLQEWDISPEQCLYVGDTSTDMQTGHNAGLFTIGVLWGFRDEAELRENNADLIVSAPAEILAFVEQG